MRRNEVRLEIALRRIIVYLMKPIRRIGNDDIEPAFPMKHFGEINLEVEGFLAVGQFVNGVFNLLFVAVFLVLVRLVEVARLQFFEPPEKLLVEQRFLHAAGASCR